MNSIDKLFGIKKPIIGMIHLAGSSQEEKVERAIEELKIYDEEGINGAIIENYHGDVLDLAFVLEESANLNLNLVKGINVLGDLRSSFNLSHISDAKFIQIDSVQNKDLNAWEYDFLRKFFPGIYILGGIRFKYKTPTGNSLEQDLEEGKSNCNIIVTTGDGTGIETSIQKLKDFKNYLGDFPLIVGAGVNLKNVTEQLSVADGAIVGSAFKPYKNTYEKVDRNLVRNFMNEVRKLR
ncbi:hypothetical protein J4474_03490 [Candidatus Pacearchaeota archaeon]|nr:hypothetical protein [Candidatus Pacearchaeota archaeon]